MADAAPQRGRGAPADPIVISDEEGGQDEPNEEEERRELGDRESEGLVHGEGSTAHGGAGFQVTWGGPPGRPQAGRVGGALKA